MRRKTLLNRNVIIVLMLFIFLMTAFVSTAYSLWYFPNSGNPKEVNADMKVDDIEENFTNTGSYLKIIDCRDGVIPKDTDFAIKNGSVFLDNSENFTDNGNTFRGKKGEDGKYRYSKKVFSVPSLNLRSFVSSVSYRPGTSATDMTEIYLYDLLNSQYKLVDHLTNESIELKDGNGTSSDGGNMDKPLDAKSYSSTKFEDYRKNIGYSFSKSRILFLVPRDIELIKNKQSETPKVVSDYNIYFHNEATSGDYDYSKLDYVWLWNDRTDFGASLPLSSETKEDGKSYKSLHINYKTLYEAYTYNDFNGKDFNSKNKNKAGFIMTSQTAPTGIIFKTKDGTKLAPKDTHGHTEYLALPLPPINSTFSHFDIYINAASNGKFTINTDQDVDLTKNKNIVYYSASGLDHLWMWSSKTKDVDRWISSNYVYKFNMTDCNKPVSCFSYNYGEKFNFYKNWKGPDGTMPDGTPAQLSPGFTFDKNEDYDNLILANYDGDSQTIATDADGKNNIISGLFDDTSEHTSYYECTSIYLLENDKIHNKDKKVVTVYKSKSEFIAALNQLN